MVIMKENQDEKTLSLKQNFHETTGILGMLDGNSDKIFYSLFSTLSCYM